MVKNITKYTGKIAGNVITQVEVPEESRFEKKPPANDLTKQRLRKLFRMFCVYNETPRGEVAEKWKNCESCILYQVHWLSQKGNEKGLLTNLCHAFWFEGALND